MILIVKKDRKITKKHPTYSVAIDSEIVEPSSIREFMRLMFSNYTAAHI